MLGQDTSWAKKDRISRLSSGPVLLIYLAAVLGTITAGYLVATGMLKWAVVLAAVSLGLPLLARPVFLLKVLSFLAPIYWLPLVPPAIYEAFRDVLFLAFFVALALAVITQKLKFERLLQDSGVKFIAVFLLAMVPSVLVSPNLRSSLLWLKALQAGLFYVGLLLVVDTEKQIHQLLLLFALGQLLSIGMLWLETISAAPGDVGNGRVSYVETTTFSKGELGLSYRRNAFSNSTAHILPIILGLGLARKGASKVIWVSSAVVAFGAILVSHGRAGLVSALVVIALMLWKRSRRYAMILLIVTLLVAFTFPSLIGDRFVSNPEWTYAVEGWARYDRLLSGRISAYLSAFEMMREDPFFGTGLGYYSSSLRHFESLAELGLDAQASSAHNLYLEVGSGAGVFSALAVTAFMIWVLRKGRRAFRTFPERAFANVLFGVVVAQFVTSLFEVEIFWTIMRAFPFWIALTGLVRFHSPPVQLEQRS